MIGAWGCSLRSHNVSDLWLDVEEKATGSNDLAVVLNHLGVIHL